MIRWLLGWLRLIFMLPTHRVVRLGPGVYVQALRGTSEAQIAAMLADHLKGRT